MNVRVRLFAALRQAAGRDLLDLEMPERATIGQLRRRMADNLPELSGLLQRAMFAVGTEYATDEAVVPPGADVACIPPVSGG